MRTLFNLSSKAALHPTNAAGELVPEAPVPSAAVV